MCINDCIPAAVKQGCDRGTADASCHNIMNACPGVNDHPDDDRAIIFFFQYMESFFLFFKHKHSSLSNPGQWRVTSPVAQLTK